MDADKSDFERRLRARIDNHRAEYAESHEQIFGHRPPALEPPPDLSGLPLDEALLAYEGWATRRTLTAWNSYFEAQDRARAEPELTPEAWKELDGRPQKKLEWVDRLMDLAFDLQCNLPHLRPAHPIRYCESLESYAAPLAQHLAWPQDRCNAVAEQVKAGASNVPLLSEPAYDLHGVGTFVNGWLLCRQRRQPHPQKLLDDDTAWAAHVLGRVAAVRWGRGFLRTYTTLGQEICRAGMAHTPLCVALGLPVSEAAQMMQRAFFLCRAGWSEWIGRFMEADMRHRLRVPVGKGIPGEKESGWEGFARLGKVAWEHLAPTVPGVDLVHSILNFAVQSIKTPRLTSAVWTLCADWAYGHYQQAPASPQPACEQRLRNFLGRVLVSDLEEQVGIANLPYALLIAGHVHYGLSEVTLSDLLARMKDLRDTSGTPDGRLVMLTMLDPSPAYSPQQLAIQAEHKLHLASPEAIRRSASAGKRGQP
jgi:hypothetical protein